MMKAAPVQKDVTYSTMECKGCGETATVKEWTDERGVRVASINCGNCGYHCFVDGVG